MHVRPIRRGSPIAALLLATLTLALSPGLPATASVASEHTARLAEVERPFRIRAQEMVTLWVDPSGGDDSASGSERTDALATLAEAWRRIPRGERLADHGYRILILPGRLGEDAVPGYMEDRLGTTEHPIIIRAAEGAGTVTLASLNIFSVRHLYLIDLRIEATGGDGLHCEQCDHLLLRRSVVRGDDPESWRIGDLVKVNQSRSVFIERSDLSGASDNALDLVAVQYAGIRRNRIHDAMDWCAYAKGGSAYVRVDGNEIFDCGTGGFTAGQGTGFQWMVPPWITYEAVDVRVVNNVVHDTEGAGLGVNGGYGILLAHNTLVRVGSRSHLLEFVAGLRSCDGVPGDAGRGRCAEHLDLGGWGTTRVDDGNEPVRIPNRQVFVIRNLIVNRTDRPVGDQILTVAGPYDGPGQDGSGVPTPTRFDRDLVFLGNVIRSGPETTPLGIGEETGCSGAGSSCRPESILAENLINERPVSLRDMAGGDFRLADPAAVTVGEIAWPLIDWSGLTEGIPPGRSRTTVPRDREGLRRGSDAPPGAWR